MSKWISVNERLPAHDTPVLAYNLNGFKTRIVVASIRKGKWETIPWKPSPKFNVTHWMPLPDNPQMLAPTEILA